MYTYHCKIHSFILVMMFLVLLFPSGFAMSAMLELKPEVVEVSRMEEFKLDIFLNAEGQEVNALELELDFDKDKLSALDILDGNSIVSIWAIKQVDNNGNVQLAGVIPTGYKEIINPETGQLDDGPIASVVFRPDAEGSFDIKISNARVFANDGKATEVDIKTKKSSIIILPSIKNNRFAYQDDIPPEFLKAEAYKEPFAREYYLAFFAKDNETGIDYYEIKEDGSSWEMAKSPYKIGQNRAKVFHIKAIDKNGNTSIVKVELESRSNALSKVILALLAMFALLAIYMLVMKTGHIKRKK